jgi:hypothetical protein
MNYHDSASNSSIAEVENDWTTHLIRQTFENRFFFQFTGIANSTKGELLSEFARELARCGLGEAPALTSWFDAFDCLRSLIERKDASTAKSRPAKKVIFLDEMPWMDTHKSRFVAALEHFWNGWASGRSDILLIACGSATSWITKKLFRSKGGLFNRVTRQIELLPFTLGECKQFFEAEQFQMNLHDMVESYMIFGGIPYYLNLLEKKYSLAGNVDRLCFGKNAKLKDEFEELFHAIFENPEKHLRVVRVLNQKKKGLTRDEVSKGAKFPDGGNLTRILQDLESCGFIRSYRPVAADKKGTLYRVADPFILFYLNFMDGRAGDPQYWSKFVGSAAHGAWSGYAFEQACLAHVPQIEARLGVGGVIVRASSWRSRQKTPGAQIDLVLDRGDNIMNLCEIKYHADEYEITGKYEAALRQKRELFRKETRTKKALHITLITTYGVKRNEHFGMVQSEVTMADLFE